jgi:hypothetical protein
MAIRVIVHLTNEDPILAEMEQMPDAGDTNITVFDPHREDGNPIHYLREGSAAVVFPMHRVSSLEVIAEDRVTEEEITFYRDEPA